MNVRQILLPKNGNTIAECEDSICIYPLKKKGNNIVHKFAVADGATETSFSKEWAQLLTSSISGRLHLSNDNFLRGLPPLREKWVRIIESKSLPWYAEQKVKSGAFSTFLGLQINKKTQTFLCMAIGDSCFVHIRKNELIKSFPITDPNDFNNNPYLLSSIIKQNADLHNHLLTLNGNIQKGDILFLMSDAIAHWFIFNNTLLERPWEILLKLLDESCIDSGIFESWLNKQRQDKTVKNDDVAIIAIEIN